MNTKIVHFVAFVLIGLWASHTAYAATPLVDIDWVKANSGKEGIVFVDLRSTPAYLNGHVPGAVHAKYHKDNWRVKVNGVKGMLPSAEHLTKLITRLGISNDSHVVLIHAGSSAAETGIATRIYWTFKVLGHENISIMNGGMRAYMKDKSNPLEKGMVTPAISSFTVKMNRSLLATDEDVAKALGSNVTLLDSRPTDQHLGINKSGSVTRHGTLPGAISIPGRWLTVNDKGTFRDAKTIARIYAARNAATSGDAIVFCNTGHWASLGWFIDHELLGNTKSKMYDGSMAAWSRLDPKTHKMVVRLNVE